MQSRAPSARLVSIGLVRQRKLVFHKRSIDGSAKADAQRTANVGDHVWGAVYRMHRNDKFVLDQHEFLGIGYDEEQVAVEMEQEIVSAWMYVARAEAIDTSLLPYTWYLDYILHGARQHRLPEAYIDRLRRSQARRDPDLARHERNRLLIES